MKKQIVSVVVVSLFFCLAACQTEKQTKIVTSPGKGETALFTLQADNPQGLIPPGRRKIMAFSSTSAQACQIDAIIVNIRDVVWYNSVNQLFLYDEQGGLLAAPPDFGNSLVYKLWTYIQLQPGETKSFYLMATINWGNFPSDTGQQSFIPEILRAEGSCEGNQYLAGNELQPRFTQEIPAYATLNPASPSGLKTPGWDVELLRINLTTQTSSFVLDELDFFVTGDDFSKVSLSNCHVKDLASGATIANEKYSVIDPTSGQSTYLIGLTTYVDSAITIDTLPRALSLTCNVNALEPNHSVQASLSNIYWRPQENYFNVIGLPVTGGAIQF